MRTKTLASLLILTYFGFSFCVDLNCNFKNESILREQRYFCIAQNDLNIYDANTEVSKINGNQLTTKSASLLTGLSIENKKTQYIPSNLGGKFTNLIALRIKNGRLKELVQEDLKSLTKLKYLNLDENDIENLENDLFEYNEKLELIWFSKNKIKSIGSTVFDNLKSLGNLDLFGNKCVSKRASFTRSVPPLLQQIKQNCSKLELKPSNKNKFSEFLEIDYKEILELETVDTTTISAQLPTKRVMINRINHQPTQRNDIFEVLKEKGEEDLRNSQKNIQSLQNDLNNLNKVNEIEKVDQNLWPNLELEKSRHEHIKIQKELKLLRNQLDDHVKMANKNKIEYENKMNKSVNLLKKQLIEKEQRVIKLELELKNCKMESLNRNIKKTIESVEISNEEIEY